MPGQSTEQEDSMVENEETTVQRKQLPPHWYKIHVTECVLCGGGKEHRERMYTPKPADAADRYDYEQFAHEEHFL
jgi:hypothetical protein